MRAVRRAVLGIINHHVRHSGLVIRFWVARRLCSISNKARQLSLLHALASILCPLRPDAERGFGGTRPDTRRNKKSLLGSLLSAVVQVQTAGSGF